MTNSFYIFLSGAACMGAAVCGTFFLRFWRKTRDRLFCLFALAFFLMALERAVLVARERAGENQPMIYLLRLAAFLLILYGIWDKNRPETKGRP